MTAQPVSLPQLVRQAIEKLLAVLRAADPDGANWVAEVRARRPERPTVVVVGETKRGKSSLVNALLAEPGRSPVDTDVATATYLVFGHADHWSAQACYPGQLPPVPFDPAELANWVSARHELPAGQLPPRYVRVDGPNPLLERLTLVDTPGVGGLNSMHGELAKEAAAEATALLFVADASAPLSAGELAFLGQIGGRVETVVFALAKTDAFRGWRQVLEADRRLLAQHAPRFARAPFYPCSPRLFEMAGRAASPDAAALLRDRSGIAALQAALQALVVGRAMMLAEANTLRALDTALASTAVTLAAQRRALADGTSAAGALRERRDQLVATRRSAARGWQVRLRGEIQRARVEVGHEVGRQMRDVQSWFRQAVDAADRETLAELPGEVDAALQRVSGDLSAGLSARLDRLARLALAELFSSEELDLIRARLARGQQQPVVIRPPERRSPNAEDRLLVFMGVSGGVAAARMAALPLGALGVAALNPFVLPVTLVVGLGAGWWLARTRRHSAEKQHVRQWLSEAIADARGTLDQLVAEQLIDAEQRLCLALDDVLARRIESIDAELREVDQSLRLANAERTSRIASIDGKLTEIRAGRERIGALLGGIRALRDRT